MSLVLLESRNSVAISGLYPIWSGMSPLMPQENRLYADILDTYICGPYDPWAGDYLLRVNTRTPEYTPEDVSPPVSISGSVLGLAVVHYWGEGGYALYTAAVEVSGTGKLYASAYPEFLGGWTDCAGPISTSGNAVDNVFPDTPNSPRFLIGIDGAGSEHVLVVLADDPLLVTRYPTNWTAMSGTGSVTDLECVRFI